MKGLNQEEVTGEMTAEMCTEWRNGNVLFAHCTES